MVYVKLPSIKCTMACGSLFVTDRYHPQSGRKDYGDNDNAGLGSSDLSGSSRGK
jgi:hypothetical protein